MIDARRLGAAIGAAVCSLNFISAPAKPAAAETAKSKPSACVAPAYREFDFWIGDWDVFDAGGTDKVARVRVDRTLDGCVLHESYEDPTGAQGESFSIYDAARRVWHQTWVTNRGTLLTIEGVFHDGSLTMSGVEHLASGAEKQVRGVWHPAAGGVSESATTSVDGGKTWQPWFDLVFKPHT